MGTFHNYASLKNHADKLVKFKQGVLIAATHSRGLISDAHYQTVKGGVCASFAMAWLVQKFGGAEFFTRGQGVSTAKSEENIGVTNNVVPSYLDYSERWAKGEADPAKQALAAEWGLDLRPSKHHFEDTFTQLCGYYEKHLHTGKGLYIAVNIKAGGGHALAMYKDDDHRHHFFDPNVGEYCIHKGKNAAFYQEYEKILKTAFAWEYTGSWGYPVKPGGVGGFKNWVKSHF